MNSNQKSILIIEDTNYHRIKLEALLREMKIGHILTAENGLEGVRMAQFYRPDIILLDLYMPVVNGFEACRRIREKTDLFETPVLIITAGERKENLEKIYKLGANDYFEKPINEQEVINRIKFYLEFSETFSKMRTLDQAVEHDMRTAQDFMRRIMPDKKIQTDNFRKAGYDFSLLYQPAYHVGGDMWTAWPLENGDVIICVMDISGHGIRASLNSAAIIGIANSAFTRLSEKGRHKIEMAAFLEYLNIRLCQHFGDIHFCVGGIFHFEYGTGRIEYAATGFPAIKSFRPGEKKVKEHPCNGLPIGISTQNFTVSEGEICLSSGDGICIMTDGIIECMPAGKTNPIDNNQNETFFLPAELLMSEYLGTIPESGPPLQAKDINSAIVDTFLKKGYDLAADDITLATFLYNPPL